MTKLPINPLVFILAYICLAVLAVVPELTGQSYSLFWAALGSCGALILQIVWAIQALAFASSLPTKKMHTARMPIARLVVLGLLLCIAFLALYHGYLAPHLAVGTPLASMAAAVSSICNGLAAILFFAVFWIAAQGICEAEENGKVPAHRVVGTFLLFVYIVIGAPFIFARLKRLGG